MDRTLEPYEKFKRSRNMKCSYCQSENINYKQDGAYYCSKCSTKAPVKARRCCVYRNCYNCGNDDVYGRIWGEHNLPFNNIDPMIKYCYASYCKECFKHEYRVYTMGGSIKPAKRPRLQ